MALVVEQDVLFDLIEIRFLSPVGVILQTQPVADMVKESFFGGSIDHLPINESSITIYNVHIGLYIAKYSARWRVKH